MISKRYSKEQLILQQLLKKLRIEAQLSQFSLAKKLCVPQSTISKYESGERHLTFIDVVAICSAFGISISKFSEMFAREAKIYESK